MVGKSTVFTVKVCASLYSFPGWNKPYVASGALYLLFFFFNHCYHYPFLYPTLMIARRDAWFKPGHRRGLRGNWAHLTCFVRTIMLTLLAGPAHIRGFAVAESAQIDRVSYTHEAIADWMLSNPSKSMKELAEHFGYTQPWISTVIHSDAFQVYFSQRRAAVNLLIHTGIATQLQNTTKKALSLLEEKLNDSEDLDGNFILDVADKLLHRQGYAPGKISITQTNNNLNVQPAGTVDATTLSRARSMMRTIQKSVGHDPNIIDVVPAEEVEHLQSIEALQG